MFTLLNKNREADGSQFSKINLFNIEEKAGSVFVPTREDYPQAIRPFPQSFQKSTSPLFFSTGARSPDQAPPSLRSLCYPGATVDFRQ